MSKLKIIQKEGENIRNTLDLFWVLTKEEYFENEELCGACAISAMALKKRLEQRGIESTVKTGIMGNCGTSHAWVETKDFLIDLTYTQFDYRSPKVLILNKKGKKFKEYVSDFEEVRVKRNFSDWRGPEHPSKWRHVVKTVSNAQKLFTKINLKTLPR